MPEIADYGSSSGAIGGDAGFSSGGDNSGFGSTNASQAAPASGANTNAWVGGTSSTASQLFGDIGGAISSFSEVGSFHDSQKSYMNAASMALDNMNLARSSELIKASQAQRQIDMTTGALKAGVAANGFAESGSAMDLLRSSQEQGALTEGVIRANGQVQENSYTAQYLSDLSMAKAAGQAAKAAGVGGWLKVAAFVGDNVQAALQYSGGGGGG